MNTRIRTSFKQKWYWDLHSLIKTLWLLVMILNQFIPFAAPISRISSNSQFYFLILKLLSSKRITEAFSRFLISQIKLSKARLRSMRNIFTQEEQAGIYLSLLLLQLRIFNLNL